MDGYMSSPSVVHQRTNSQVKVGTTIFFSILFSCLSGKIAVNIVDNTMSQCPVGVVSKKKVLNRVFFRLKLKF